MKNIDSKKELEKKAMEFYADMDSLLRKYDVISDNEPHFRLVARNFTFSGPRNGPCGDRCSRIEEVVVNGVKRVKIICFDC